MSNLAFPISVPNNYLQLVNKYCSTNLGKLVVYGQHFKTPDNILLLAIELATIKLNEPNQVRLIHNSKTGEHHVIAKELVSPYLTYMGGFLSKVDLALKAPEGTEFKGWRRSKQYRLTRAEIDNLINNKLFIFDYYAPLRKQFPN